MSTDQVVVVAGEALVDLVPAPTTGYFEMLPGGSPANVAVGLARLGVPVHLLARISDDLLGRRVRAHLERNGVGLDHAVAAAEPTSLAIVDVAPDGSPVYDFRIDGTADWQWTPREVAGVLDERVVAVHSGSLALTMPPGAGVLRDLLYHAAATATVSYDPNCRPALMGDAHHVLGGVHDLLGVADVVKASAEDLAWLLPGHSVEHVLEDWLRRGPAIVAVTLGEQGVVAGTAAGLRVRRPAVPVPVQDTVGAGDAFSAALLSGLYRRGLLGARARPRLRALDEDTLTQLLDEATLAAALTCTRRGADPPTTADLAHTAQGPTSALGSTRA